MLILKVYKRVPITYRLIFAMTCKQSYVVSQRVIVIKLRNIKFSRILKELFILHPNHSVPSLLSVYFILLSYIKSKLVSLTSPPLHLPHITLPRHVPYSANLPLYLPSEKSRFPMDIHRTHHKKIQLYQKNAITSRLD